MMIKTEQIKNTHTAGKSEFPHPVEVPLTDREMLAYTDELTALDTSEKEILKRHESEKSHFKTEIKEVDQKRERLLHILKMKEETKQLSCQNDFDFYSGIVEIIRCDTGEIVTTRKITAEEFKDNLPILELAEKGEMN